MDLSYYLKENLVDLRAVKDGVMLVKYLYIGQGLIIVLTMDVVMNESIIDHYKIVPSTKCKLPKGTIEFMIGKQLTTKD